MSKGVASASEHPKDCSVPTRVNHAIRIMETDSAAGWDLLYDLIQEGPNMDEVDEDGFSALMYAVRHNAAQVIPYLVNSGANVDLLDEDGNAPLYYAAMFRFYDVMSVLISVGANPNLRDRTGRTLLDCAVDLPDTNSIDKLLKFGADPNSPHPDGVSTLLISLSHPHYSPFPENVSKLLQAGAKPNVPNREGITPLMKACMPKNTDVSTVPEVVQMLIDAGAKLEIKDTEGKTALHHSKFSHNLPLLQVLLDNGVDLNAADIAGNCVWSDMVHYLTKTYHPHVDFDLLRTYLEHGADPNLVTPSLGPGTLMSTVFQAFGAQGVHLLMSYGADLSVTSQVDQQYQSPFKSALENLPDTLPVLDLIVDGLYFTPDDTHLCSTTESHHLSKLLIHMREIPSLKQLSRRAVHRAMKCLNHREKAMMSLPVAPKLYRYILYQDGQNEDLIKSFQKLQSASSS